jgi:site-specific recombinase XerD
MLELPMTRIKLPYVQEYMDRHDKVRRYVRRRGLPRVPLPGLPGSAEFMAAYQDAISGTAVPKPSRYGVGSIGQLVTDFYSSPAFANLKPSSQRVYRIVLGSLAEKHGHRKVRDMPTEKARKIVQDIGATRPGMANLVRSVLHRLIKHAIKIGWRNDNPVSGVETYKLGEHHTWTDEELAAYKKRWPLGTRERLAYALLLYTDQRVGDVVRMKRDIKDGTISIVQEKTGAVMTIAIHSALMRAIRAGPADGIYLIGDKQGRPLKRAGLTRLVKRAARDAGLPKECIPHGLRKALQRLLSEHGATGKELQAVAGHVTLKETERYTRAADQARLFRSAIERLPDEG